MTRSVSIGGRTITNLRFVDDIDGLDGQEQELVKLVNHLEEASTAYGMQISAEKTQLMTNNTNGISTDITIDDKKFETVRSFKYLGAIVSDGGSKPEVLSKIFQTTAAATKPKVIWNDKDIAISSKIRLMRSLAMSIFLHACETRTITADIERIHALQMRCFRKVFGISYRYIPMRKWRPELEMPSGCMKTSWLQWKDASWSGMGTSHNHLDWPRLSYR